MVLKALKWVVTQCSPPRLLRAFFILAVLGFVPYAWMVGVPLLVGYGTLKRESIVQSAFIQHVILFFSRPAPLMLSLIRHRYELLFKLSISIFSLMMYPLPFNILMVLGVIHFPLRAWASGLFQPFKRLILGQRQSFDALLRSREFYKRFGKYILLPTMMLIGLLALIGLELIVWASYLALGYAMLSVGWHAFKYHCKDAFYAPMRKILDNIGKLFGLTWGHWIAYKISPGHISGSLGHVMGTVQSKGLLSLIMPSFLSPNAWFIGPNTSIGRLFAGPLGRLGKSLINGLFFNYEMHLTGDIYGYIGPSTFQIFFWLCAGCFAGYLVELGVQYLLSQVYRDSTRQLGHGLDFFKPGGVIYQSKYQISLTCVASALLLASPAGVGLAAIMPPVVAYLGLMAGILTVYQGLKASQQIVGEAFFGNRVQGQIQLPPSRAMTFQYRPDMPSRQVDHDYSSCSPEHIPRASPS